MVGKQFAHYVVLEEAGAGGMGVVYRARDEKLQRDVALKLPAEKSRLDETVREKLLAEARLASGLNHPNICTIYEVGEFEGQPYIAMEYLAGEPLNRHIPGEGLPTETALHFGAQVASALEHAHLHGVLHRDLKSANVRMTAGGQVKVLDFGLAMSFKDVELEAETSSSIMDSSQVSGTLAYLAPEVLAGVCPDARADIWSLGVLLYEMASGKHPFWGRTSFEMSTSIFREAPKPLPTYVPPGLRTIILRCLAKEPEQRYQRASEVRAALEALHSNAGVISDSAEGMAAWGGERKEPRKVSYWWWATAGVAVGFGIFYFYSRATKPRATAVGPSGKIRLLLSTEKNIAGPGLSPDGKMVAYAERNGAQDDLYVGRVAGGERVRLTKDNSVKGEPTFSPDGEKIAFARKVATEPAGEICTIPTFGGEIRPVVQGASMPAWSPDGTKLAYVLRKPGEAETLAISPVEGGEGKEILAGDAIYPFLGRPAWSPDGQWIAVSRSRGGESREIWLAPVNGGSAKQLTHEPVGVTSDTPVFASGGRGVIFQSNSGGASNLWYQALDGKEAKQLTTGPGPDASPSIARDGTIAFLNSRTRTLLFLYKLGTEETTTLASDASILWAPAFSPDGTEVAYARDEPDGSWHLWSMATAGGPPRQLTFGKVPEIYARYAPDGERIFYNTWGVEPLSIWTVPRTGGPARPFETKSQASDAYADVSPDGKWVAFVRAENKVAHVYVQAADGSVEARRLLETPAAVPRWSPDGEWIAFSPDRSFSGGVFIVHPDGSGLKRVAERGGWPVWWPDGERIGRQEAGPDSNTEIRVVNWKTGKSTVLRGLHFVGMNYPFDVSKDGKWMVTTNAQHISDEIWLLEPEGKK